MNYNKNEMLWIRNPELFYKPEGDDMESLPNPPTHFVNVKDEPGVCPAHNRNHGWYVCIPNLGDPVVTIRPDWDPYFLSIARTVATRADCRRRMVGCVIVDADHRIVSTGYNGAPSGDVGCLDGGCPRGLLSYDEVQEFTNYDSGPGRCISLHAEANALLYAGRQVRGCTAYVTAQPCPTCDKLLRGAGIARVVF